MSHPGLEIFPVLGDIVLGTRSVPQPDLFVIPRPPSRDTPWRELNRPLLVVEILSASTPGRDRLIKRRLYQQAEIPEYWIVDLDARLVERWRPGDERPEILSETMTWRLSELSSPVGLELTDYMAIVTSAG